MRIKHQFKETGIYAELINQVNERLLINDYCIYCNLIVDYKMLKLFDYSNYNDDDDELMNIYNELNIKYPCLTEDEYMIKNLLE